MTTLYSLSVLTPRLEDPMKKSFASQGPARLIRLALAGTLLACGTVGVYVQPAPTSQDVQALAAEIGELKRRLAAVEAKLAAYQAAPVTPAAKPESGSATITWLGPCAPRG
jgi:hypothetical protein